MYSNNKFGTMPSALFKCGMLLIIFLSTTGIAQAKTWKTVTRDHGKIKIQYSVSKRIDEEGNKVPWIRYTAVTVEKISMKKVIALFRDPIEYGKLIGLKTCEKIKSISDNEWVNYSTASPGWPIADFDWVARMTFSENTNTRTVVFTSTADPTFIERTILNQNSSATETYTFKDLGNGEIEITITLEETPTVKVPRWLLHMAIPGNATGFIQKIVIFSKLDEGE